LRDEKITRQQLLARGYEGYARHHRVPDYVRRAVWAILACRTALLGGHVQACPDGHIERMWYNSCRHRMCPPCAWVQTARGLARQTARLLACEHYRVIFTMPHELNALWLANVEAMSQLLFASVHDTLCELLGDAKYLGATPGVIATLHTWSQTLLLHPHLHCLVTGGGLTDAGQWVAVRHGFLRPMRVVMAGFRGQLQAAIRQGVHQGRLTPPKGKSRQQVDNVRNKLGRQKGNRRGTCIFASGIRPGPGCSSIWHGIDAEGPSPTGGYVPGMASRWSSGMRSGPQALGTRRSSARCPYPSSSSWGAGSCMSRHRTQCGCAAGACMPTRKEKRWRGAGSKWAQGRSRDPSQATGRARMRHGERHLQSAVRFVGNDWCARPSSPGPESHHPLRRIGRRWHEAANSQGRLEVSLLGIGAPCSGAFKCSLAPRRPRCLPMLVPTAPRAGDVCLAMERFEGGLAIQAP
jgi:Transposase zinc-binding domain/Putative transposase